MHIASPRSAQIAVIERASTISGDNIQTVGHAALIEPFFSERGPARNGQPLAIFQKYAAAFASFAKIRVTDAMHSAAYQSTCIS